MNPLYYLTGRGIRQAIEKRYLEFDPALEDWQIQLATVDVCFESIDSMLSMESIGTVRLGKDNVILRHHEAEVIATQSVRLNRRIGFMHELRSSLRRLSCYSRGGGMVDPCSDDKFLIEVITPGPISIQLTQGDKIAQIFFFFL